MTRKLAAILAVDVVSYSRLMSDNEPGALAALQTHRAEVIAPSIVNHGGREEAIGHQDRAGGDQRHAEPVWRGQAREKHTPNSATSTSESLSIGATLAAASPGRTGCQPRQEQKEIAS